MEKLVIIGNGFDLTIGLKSRYEDFYNRRNKKNISLWEMMIEDQKDDSKKNWSDIEKFIEEKLSSQDDLEEIFGKYIDELKNDDDRKRYSKDEDIVEILTLELKKFEKDFQNYLVKEFRRFNRRPNIHEGRYYFYSDKLFSHLVKGSNLKEVSVLNFNYTTPNFKGINPKNIVNIHGTLDSNIVIGTDLKIISSGGKQQYTNFTKPFKILDNYIDDSNVSILKNKKYGELIFYGHSLGDTDFSYFKSIFDSLNLYSGDVTLKFFVAIYDKNKEKIIDEFNHSVLRLLNRYSADLINVKDDDISLFTKLLLEGRLEIIPIYTLLNDENNRQANKLTKYHDDEWENLASKTIPSQRVAMHPGVNLRKFLQNEEDKREYLKLITIEKEICKLQKAPYRNKGLEDLENEQKEIILELANFDEKRCIDEVYSQLENNNAAHRQKNSSLL